MTTTPTDRHGLSAADHQQLETHGIGVAEARRQLAVLRNPPPRMRLARPARVGDGITPFPEGAEADRFAAAGRGAARYGRLVKFVPASGAASRLFSELRAALLGGAGDAPVLARFEEARPRFAFDGDLRQVLDRYGEAPKALIPFHRYAVGEQRTALEEHLVEAAAVLGGAGRAAVHFSVASRHRRAFDALLEERLPDLERRLGCRFDVTFSSQAPATDSIAVDAEGRPFRTEDDPEAPLLVRPGGHGALLGNLQQLADRGFELIALKNIDNVQPERSQQATVRALRVLAGMARELTATSSRPSRVCGVVPTTRTAGGGPFWVHGDPGPPRLQIVETSEVDLEDPDQAAIVDRSSHFNPVLLVCAPLRPEGSAYRLEDYVDQDTSFIVNKSFGGRDLTALERPGLWNGSMAGWETRLVELPSEVFTPVKTIFDLAADAHQCGGVAP